jgi:hypothetical protein
VPLRIDCGFVERDLDSDHLCLREGVISSNLTDPPTDAVLDIEIIVATSCSANAGYA